jgi:hypothetical protein
MKQMLIPVLLLCLFGCSNQQHKEMATDAVVSAEASAASNRAGTYTENETQKNNTGADEQDLKAGKTTIEQKVPLLIIKNANVQFQVSSVEASHAKIAGLLAKYNAYFGSDNRTSNSHQVENNMVIRVTAANFDKLMDELMQESVYTNYRNVSAEDITAEFTDIQARLKTKKEVEQRYLALLRQSAKITDILEVEEKIRVIREEIEAAEGREKLLKDQVGYSTINLNMYQKFEYAPEQPIGFFSLLTQAFVNGWRGLLEVLIGLVRVWPFMILLGCGAFFGLRALKNKN